MKICINSIRPVIFKSDASSAPEFDKSVDTLGIDSVISSYFAIPIEANDMVLGVFVFVNSNIGFEDDDYKIAEFLTLIPRDLLNNKHEAALNMN